jgi:hypothetical protein
MAEAQVAAELRRKDPVKRSIWIASFLLLAVVLWFAKVQMDVRFEKNNLSRIEGEWKGLTTKYAAVTNEQARTSDVEKKLAALDRLSTNRFLWAPVLNALQKTMVDNVQVVRIRGQQSFAHEAAHTQGSGASKQSFPASTVENDALYIEAKDLRPADQDYSKYKESLGNSDFFIKRLGRRDGFVMDGVLGPVTGDPLDPSKQYVTFTLASHFPEARRND